MNDTDVLTREGHQAYIATSPRANGGSSGELISYCIGVLVSHKGRCFKAEAE